jgi:hypothetical protein
VALSAWWPKEADRVRRTGGLAWSVQGDPWGLRLLPLVRPTEQAPVQVFLTEQSSAVVDGRRWLHEADLWFHHPASADLSIRLPEGVRVLAVAVDGAAATPLQTAAGRLLLRLPAGPGTRWVRLRWMYEDDQDDRGGAAPPLRTQPRLQRPVLEGAANGPVVWTVYAPPGHEVQPGAGAVALSAASVELRRADAQYRVSRALVEAAPEHGRFPPDALDAAQRRFYESCRYAALGLGSSADLGPKGQPLADWLQELQEQNRRLARAHGFEALRTQAEQARTNTPEQAWGRPTARHGVPTHWGADSPEAPPQLQLAPVRGDSPRRAVAVSLLLGVLLLSVWVLAQFPGILAWCRAFWPEQMALLGLLGWQALGPNLAVIFLLALGLSARIVYLIQWGAAWLRAPVPAPAAPAAGDPGSTSLYNQPPPSA